jgi:hypothetical protein
MAEAAQLRAALHARTLASTSAKRAGVALGPVAPGQLINTQVGSRGLE